MSKITFLWLSALLMVAVIGYHVGRDSVQSPNDLIAAGFTITDNEVGDEVANFTDGLPALAEKYFGYSPVYCSSPNNARAVDNSNPFADSIVIQ